MRDVRVRIGGGHARKMRRQRKLWRVRRQRWDATIVLAQDATAVSRTWVVSIARDIIVALAGMRPSYRRRMLRAPRVLAYSRKYVIWFVVSRNSWCVVTPCQLEYSHSGKNKQAHTFSANCLEHGVTRKSRDESPEGQDEDIGGEGYMEVIVASFGAGQCGRASAS